ncbi:MAG: 16S rRNA (guanine966-N2)-methyltransferase [Paracoccaceae bacterium]|jgi:16S rRNA (guanine966-N2)-methyltransferase
MRIIAGHFRGTALAALGKGDAAAHLRPTSDRVRESLFNVLFSTHGNPVQDARVLDLFAGTGALGLEALSRGARSVVFVDDGAKARALLQDNIAKTRSADRTTLVRRDATRLGPVQGQAFDLVFLDPPYGKGLGAKALIAAHGGGWLAPGATVIWEEDTPQEVPAPLQNNWRVTDTRRYGDTHITILGHRDEP